VIRPRSGVDANVIGIDASRLGIQQRTGTETYSWETIKALASLAPDEHVRLYANGGNPPDFLPPAWQTRSIPFPRFWTHARLSAEMIQHPPAVLWVPAHVIPAIHPRSVVTIHDLGYLHRPEGHTDRQRRMLHLTTRWSARAASAIIAISQATRNDLVEHYGVSPSRISVIPHGVADHFTPADPLAIADLRRQLDLRRPFVLAVGTIQPRKNYDGLAKAMEILKARGFPHQLVIAGKPGWLSETVREAITDTRIGHDVRFLDYVPSAELPTLISAASVVAFPSWYEGFGLPALEAMRCGTPVVASNRGALPEVVGDAGLIIDPSSPESMASAIEQMLTSDAFANDVRQRGLKRSAEFTWEATAARTLTLLRNVAELPGR
jgi:glycosyltransferase involved in cell wall biosynthesis